MSGFLLPHLNEPPTCLFFSSPPVHHVLCTVHHNITQMEQSGSQGQEDTSLSERCWLTGSEAVREHNEKQLHIVAFVGPLNAFLILIIIIK